MNLEKLIESLNVHKKADADLKEDDYFGVIPFDSEVDERVSVYNYLWISEKLLL